MTILLDSNVLLWLTTEPGKLTEALVQELDASRRLFLSVASIWELEIKKKKRKLRIADELWDEVSELDIDLIAIDKADALAAARLPLHHRDPFDRMIIAQALARGLTIVTRDSVFAEYGVRLLMA